MSAWKPSYPPVKSNPLIRLNSSSQRTSESRISLLSKYVRSASCDELNGFTRTKTDALGRKNSLSQRQPADAIEALIATR